MDNAALDRALHEYIGAFLGAPPAGSRDELDSRDRLMRYFYTVIDSSFTPTMGRNEEALVAAMQKRKTLGRRGACSMLQISSLCSSLKRADPSYDWWPVLYFMHECCTKTLGSTGAAPPSSYFVEPQPQPRPLGAGSAPRATPLLQQVRYSYESGSSRPNTAGSGKRGRSTAAFAAPPHQRHRPETATPASRASPPQDHADVFLHRELPTYDDVPEAELLQDMIYVMQGVDGSYVRWNRLTSSYAIRPDVNLSRPTRAMIGLLSELGVLIRDIQDYTDTVDQQGRLFEQGFCTELKAETEKYYQLVSETESKLFKAPRALLPGESLLGATLRRMYSWTTEARQRLRLMATAIAKVQESRGGGDVLSIISTLVDDGDPFIQSFAERLLKTASTPFNSILVSWVTDGELVDPYREFFIRESEIRPDMQWGERYTVEPDMIPVHINRDMTRKIFQIGRSLNFLRVACNDAQWVAEGGPRTQLVGDMSDPGSLETFVCSSASMVNERLMSVLKTRFDLMGHIEAIRRYLLFEKGDFALALMEVLDNQESHANKNIMAHDLSAVLASAVRSSNAQHETPERLAALVLMLPKKTEQKNSGWDDVTLSYHLSAPLNHVVSRPTMDKYVAVSQFLLKLKRIEYALHSAWLQQMTGSRSQLRSEDLQKRRDGTGAAPDRSQAALRKAAREITIACSEMIQFFQQVQRYISLNVIEGAWAKFLKATSGNIGELGIDLWNAAHSKYIGSIHDVVCGARNGTRGFQHILAEVLITAPRFIVAVRELNSEQALAARRPGPDARAGLAEHAKSVHNMATRFRTQVKEILSTMSRTTAGELPFLVVTVDFNKKYTSSA
ncbi:Microtubule-nucleating Tub4p (gamma-tubulin) complex component [Coemansia spiralis]|nr:Microtubule-nucleating Tub4p (gamma-tubulin) complex component [Coemansia spiralis]